MIKIKITFKILGTGFNNYYQADIKIYDDNNLIYDGRTYNGKIMVYLNKNKVYSIYIRLFNTCLITSLYVLNQDLIIINLNQEVNNNLVTFLLTDYHYDNLPIMKGVMLIGKNN